MVFSVSSAAAAIEARSDWESRSSLFYFVVLSFWTERTLSYQRIETKLSNLSAVGYSYVYHVFEHRSGTLRVFAVWKWLPCYSGGSGPCGHACQWFMPMLRRQNDTTLAGLSRKESNHRLLFDLKVGKSRYLMLQWRPKMNTSDTVKTFWQY